MLKKKFNSHFKLDNLYLEDARTFSHKYKDLYYKRRNIAKNQFLLTNAFNTTKLKRNINKEFLEYFNEESKTTNKLNIFNYKKSYINKNNDFFLDKQEDNVLQTLLFRIDSKNIEELLKNQRKIIRLRRNALKGLSIPNELLIYHNTEWNNFNKTYSVKSENNFSKNKSKELSSINVSTKIYRNCNNSSNDAFQNNYKENNTLSNDRFHKKYESERKKIKIQRIIDLINSEEKVAFKNSRIFNHNINLINQKKYFKTLKLDSKKKDKAYSIDIEQKNNIMKYIDKIKHQKDLQRILYKKNKYIFNEVKNKLYTLYKEGKKLQKEEEED